jgi:hypothetical protein
MLTFQDNDAQMQVTKFLGKKVCHCTSVVVVQNLCSLISWKFMIFKRLVGSGFCCSDCSVSRIIYGRCTATCAEYIMLDSFSLQQMDCSGTSLLEYCRLMFSGYSFEV